MAVGMDEALHSVVISELRPIPKQCANTRESRSRAERSRPRERFHGSGSVVQIAEQECGAARRRVTHSADAATDDRSRAA
jgi:hypothetical protein